MDTIAELKATLRFLDTLIDIKEEATVDTDSNDLSDYFCAQTELRRRPRKANQ